MQSYRKTELKVHEEMLREEQRKVNKSIRDAKSQHYNGLIETSADNSKILITVTKKLLGEKREPVFPEHTSSITLAENFGEFFVVKVDKIRKSISSVSPPISIEPYTDILLEDVDPVTCDMVKKDHLYHA